MGTQKGLEENSLDSVGVSTDDEGSLQSLFHSNVLDEEDVTAVHRSRAALELQMVLCRRRRDKKKKEEINWTSEGLEVNNEARAMRVVYRNWLAVEFANHISFPKTR